MLPSSTRIFVYVQPIDMRRSFDTLGQCVREVRADHRMRERSAITSPLAVTRRRRPGCHRALDPRHLPPAWAQPGGLPERHRALLACGME